MKLWQLVLLFKVVCCRVKLKMSCYLMLLLFLRY